MTENHLDLLIEGWSDGSLSLEESEELNSSLRSSPEARRAFMEAAALHGMLHAAANSVAIESAARQTMTSVNPVSSRTNPYFGWRNMIGVVVGMTMGIVGVSAVWALSSPAMVAVSRPVATLNNESFEHSSDKIKRGFPIDFGDWSGDDVEVVRPDRIGTPAEGRALRFVTAMPDAGNPGSRAIACDLFQLVDLRNLQISREKTHDIVLELSAHFLDERPRNSQPSVSFFCQIYLFRGDVRNVHEQWPGAISDATSSGSAEVTTLGESDWREITARCLVPDQVDFAVVHLAACPNLRVPMPSGLFVDQVELVAKTQPVLPVRNGRKE